VSNFVPDIPRYASVSDTPEEQKAIEAHEKLYVALKKKYQPMLLKRAALFKNNIQYYQAKRPFPGDPNEKIFKHVFKDADFIVADPMRYQVGGMDLPNLKMFLLHRPGDDPASCTLENVVGWFAMPGTRGATHFVAGQDGRLVQMVDLNDIAGIGGYAPTTIGVEMEGPVGDPISEQLYRVTASLIARVSLLSAAFSIDEEHIIEHRKIQPKDRHDVCPPLQIPKLIALAKQLVPTYNKEDLFKQLSTSDAAKGAMATVMSLSTWGVLSAADQATLQAMANNTDSMQRSVNFATYTRGDLASAAAQQSVSRTETETQLLAFQMSLVGAGAKVTPQTNVLGVLYDQATGLYNNGKTQ